MNDEIDFALPQTKILVVEDDAADRALVEGQIKKLWPDSDIVHVKSIHGTYDQLKKKNFDMVLLDLNIEDAFGPCTVQEVRKFDRKTPIIVMTGMLTSITADQSLINGANNIVSKNKILDDDFFNILEQNLATSK